jgi:flagellin
MAISIQTNVNSLVAQENLRVNSNFQSKTIQRLTSGYRINQAGDDAAGLAVANKFRSSVAELSQGVRNANDGMGQLQIIDGGLNNINKIVDRLKTLATQSGSDTYTGDRGTLNSEYQSLIKEIDRQASNVGLVNLGDFNKKLSVYLGGGSSQSNAQVAVDLSGTANQVDSSGLNISSTGIDAGGTDLTANNVATLNDASTKLLAGVGAKQTFSINYVDSTGVQQTKAATVTSSSATGITVSDAVSQLNKQISSIGMTAAVNTNGKLVLGGNSPFALLDATVSGGGAVNSGLVSDAAHGINKADYNVTVSGTASMAAALKNEIVSFSNGTITKFVTLDASNLTTDDMVTTINDAVSSMGIKAVATDSGANGGFAIQSSSSFTMALVQKDDTAADGSDGVAVGPWTTGGLGQAIAVTDPDTTASTIGNSLAALSAIDLAVSKLGQVQGRVGAGENQLMYAITLAQSQISNFSSAEAQIRDADVAAEAANLTKAQVLQQASMAAMAQANSAPQQVLSLLRG